MNKKYIWGLVSLSALLLAIAAYYFAGTFGVADEREAYEAFLAEHPYTQIPNIPPGGLKAIPKKDRPDLAAEFEFIRTMDPKLQRPATERLLDLLKTLEDAPVPNAIPGDNENPWVERGPNNVGGRTRAIMFDPNDPDHKKVWAAGVSGGIWYNNDITQPGTSWQKVDDFWDNINIGTLVYDPSSPQTFYAGTGEFAGSSSGASGAGIWKSVDGGQSWRRLVNTTPAPTLSGGAGSDWFHVARMAVAPNGDVYAGTRGYYTNRGGLYKSEDGGETWTKVLSRNSGRWWVLDVETEANGDVYAAFSYPAALYRSTDGGESWQLLLEDANVGRLEFSVNDTDGTVYALGHDSDASGQSDMAWIKKMSPGSDEWLNLPIPEEVVSGADFTRGQAWYDLIVESRPDDPNTVLIGGISLHRSTNGGRDWDSLSVWHPSYSNRFGLPAVHADQHNIVFRPGHPEEAIFSNDGGVYYSPNVGNPNQKPNFTGMNNGYNVTQFYAAAIHPEQGMDYYLGGTQDNGTHRFNSAGLDNTDEVTGGDGGFCFIDKDQPDIQISSYIFNSYWVTTNSWDNYNTMVFEFTGRFINPCDYDSETNTLFAAYDNNSIAYYRNVATAPAQGSYEISLGSTASAVKFYRNNAGEASLFLGTGSGRLFRVANPDDLTNSGYTEITGPDFPTGYINCIEVGENEDEIVAIFSNYGVNSVWHTRDGGQTWYNKEANLPDIPIRWALFNPTNRNEILLATELGIWVSDDFQEASPSWRRSNNSLANTRIDMLQLRRSDFQVVAATHGRGFFTSNAFALPDIVGPAIALSGDLDFGLQWQGTQVSRVFNLRNIGTEPLLVDSITAPEGFVFDWEQGVLEAGEEVQINLSFDLTEVGNYSGDLVVHSNAQAGSESLPYYIEIAEVAFEIASTGVVCGNDGTGTATFVNLNNILDLVYEVEGLPASNTGLLTGLNAGTYLVKISSEQERFIVFREVTIAGPAPIVLSLVNAQRPTCTNLNNGRFDLQISGGAPPYNIELDNVLQSTMSYSEVAPGEYTIKVMDNAGCSDSISVDMRALNIAPAKPSLRIVSGVEGVSSIMTIASNVSGDVYRWYTNGNRIAGADGIRYSVQPTDFENGSAAFQVEIENEAGCTEISEPLVITANEAELIEQSFRVYPNPASSTVNLQWDALGAQKSGKVQVFNTAGQLLETVLLSPNTSKRLNVAGYPQGTYLIQLQLEGYTVVKKLLKK